MQMQTLQLVQRSCECCEAVSAEPLWQRSAVVQKTSNAWQFDVRVAVCRHCGFLFASPAPDAASLYRYYADGISTAKEIGLAYDIDRRIEALTPYASATGRFVEVGSDGADAFHARLATLFGSYESVDVSSDLASRVQSVADLPDGYFDVVAHYDVLEHVVEVRQFLSHCRRALKEDGHLFCEVPDARLYPRNVLVSEFEHVNHFTVTTLALAASRVGLELVDVSHSCSRPFGMLTIFRKASPATTTVPANRHEYVDAIANLRGGLRQLQETAERIAAARHQVAKVAAAGGGVVLWAVTDFLRDFLSGFDLPSSVVVVDMDPRRKEHLEAQGIRVYQPHECVDAIRACRLVVLFAPRYRQGVLDHIEQLTGRSVGASELVVIGADRSGQTLN